MDKENLRQKVLEERKSILDKEKKDKIIQDKVLNFIISNNILNILIYISKDLEIDTMSLIKKLINLNKNVYAPRVKKQDMNFYLIDDITNLKLGKFNILEPISEILFQDFKNCCMIVPGLLFDTNGNRLGYGRGYYDRYLSDKKILKIGIVYSKFLVEKINADKHDIKMDMIITEV